MSQVAIPATLMRGGTSRGLYFLATDLPSDPAVRDRVLLAIMGSPDQRQTDGVGGGHPLTSKVAILAPSARDDIDVEYLFLQVAVDKASVSDGQNCGNILAGVGPWAIEHGLVTAQSAVTPVRILMLNSGGVALATVQTPEGQVTYEGDTQIDGVPGTSAAVTIDFLDVAGSACGALLPTGNAIDSINDTQVTCIDNGMPVVLLRAADFGLTGAETPAVLESDDALKQRVEAIRRDAGPLMNLGDVSDKTIPKMCLVSSPAHGGVIGTRTFIPHRVHESLGVLGAVSVATACLIPGSVTEGVAVVESQTSMAVEHPSGAFTIAMQTELIDGEVLIRQSALVRTARKIFKGETYVSQSLIN